jgi:hypothetical protein
VKLSRGGLGFDLKTKATVQEVEGSAQFKLVLCINKE